MKLTARLLPRMPVQSKDKTYTGWESGSTFSPSLLTRIADRATELYTGLYTGLNTGLRDRPWSREPLEPSFAPQLGLFKWSTI
jgi:hypothetical protein